MQRSSVLMTFRICDRRSLVRKRRTDFDVAETRRRGAVSGAHGLHRLALTAIWCAPKRPMIAGTNCIAGVPKLGCNSAVAGILQHARLLAALDSPAELSRKLKLITGVVDGPRAIGFHEDSVVCVGD